MAKNFNNNIKVLRKKLKISQDELSNATGIERSILSRIENNKIETSIDNAYKLATYFNIPIEQLISEDLTYKENVQLDSTHKLDAIILDKSKELTEEDKEKLINVIDTIFEKK